MTWELAEAAVKHLFEGEWLTGITFGAVLQINFSGTSKVRKPGYFKPYINPNCGWAVFDERPDKWPVFDEEPPGLPIGEQLALLHSLNQIDIVQVELLKSPTHLILTFANGRVLLISGQECDPEAWQAGTWLAAGSQNFTIIANGCGEFHCWCPDEFLTEWSSGTGASSV